MNKTGPWTERCDKKTSSRHDIVGTIVTAFEQHELHTILLRHLFRVLHSYRIIKVRNSSTVWNVLLHLSYSDLPTVTIFHPIHEEHTALFNGLRLRFMLCDIRESGSVIARVVIKQSHQTPLLKSCCDPLHSGKKNPHVRHPEAQRKVVQRGKFGKSGRVHLVRGISADFKTFATDRMYEQRGTRYTVDVNVFALFRS